MVQKLEVANEKVLLETIFFCYFQDILLKGLEMTYVKLHRARTDNILDLRHIYILNEFNKVAHCSFPVSVFQNFLI